MFEVLFPSPSPEKSVLWPAAVHTVQFICLKGQLMSPPGQLARCCYPHRCQYIPLRGNKSDNCHL